MRRFRDAHLAAAPSRLSVCTVARLSWTTNRFSKFVVQDKRLRAIARYCQCPSLRQYGLAAAQALLGQDNTGHHTHGGIIEGPRPDTEGGKVCPRAHAQHALLACMHVLCGPCMRRESLSRRACSRACACRRRACSLRPCKRLCSRKALHATRMCPCLRARTPIPLHACACSHAHACSAAV